MRATKRGAIPRRRGTLACEAVRRLWRISTLCARNRERVRSGSAAPTAPPAARALLAAKILRGPASCARCARAVFASRRAFSPASGRRRSGLGELKASHVEAEPASAPGASPNDCSIAAPVRITSIGLPGGAKLDLPAHPLLDCSFAIACAGFLRDLVAPLGEALLGSTVVALDTGPGYYCRSVDRVPGAKVSPHGKGIAIDVSAILLADRRRIAVGHEASPQEALFMQTMRRAGCGWFTTILGPGDPDHADHFHFDILRHGASDNYRICE